MIRMIVSILLAVLFNQPTQVYASGHLVLHRGHHVDKSHYQGDDHHDGRQDDNQDDHHGE